MFDLSAIIIVQDTLRASGIKQILKSSFGIDARIIHSAIVNEIAECDIIFADEYNCMAFLDLLIPRKNRTVIITNIDNDSYISWQHINCYDNENTIVETIAAILKKLSQTNMPQMELSAREIEVLRLVAQGFTNKEIADNLRISVNTVLSHRKNITAKLGIKSVSGLCVYAMMNGILA